MSTFPSQGRRRSARNVRVDVPQPQKEPTEKKRRSPRGVIPGLLLMAAALAVLVLLSPKDPQQRAYYTAGSDTGLVSDLTGEDGVVSAADAYYRSLRISEIMPSNHTAVPDENGSFADWVEVWNSGSAPVDLYGVGLSDKSNSIRFLFPQMTLQPDERVIIFCDNTNRAEVNQPFHAKFKLSSVGESVFLYDPNAFLIDSVTYRILGSDTSWSLTGTGWQEVTFYSPGFENSLAGHEAYRAATMVTGGAILINEVMPDAMSGLTDEDGEFSDWIELYNTTDQIVYLSNYALSDKENRPTKWRFPDGAVIAPHGYYVVFCSGKDRRDDPTAIPHANFRLSAEHDTVILADSRGRVVDRVILDNVPEDCSWGRDPNGVFSLHYLATPGRDNDDISGADQDMRRRNPTGVYLTEVMASNDATVTEGNTDFVDWVELWNSTARAVDLSGFGLSDNIGRPRRWQFPQGTVLQPGAYLLVWCDGMAEKSSAAQLHTNYRILRAGGETICLSDPNGHVLDKLVLPLIPTDVSYGRTSGTTGFFYYDAPTPKAANENGFRGYAPTPVFSEQGGLHYGTVTVSISTPANCTVYYTTDGSIPTPSTGTVYNGQPLSFNFTTVLRARAVSNGDLHASEIVTTTYFINIYHTLPVVSVICDPEELYNEQDGIFTYGANADKTVIPFANTIYREFGKIPRLGYMEYYTVEGEQLLSQGMAVSLSGDYSLDMPQKSLALRAKSLYGAKTFNAALFDDRPYTEYKRLVLRNAGNDCVFTRVLDGLNSRMLDDYGSTVIHQAWQPVVVYINGMYWGHMNLRERVDKFFVAQHEGLPFSAADGITILEHGTGTLKSGSDTVRREYRAMINRIKSSDPAKNPEDLQYILDNVDVDNYFEYIALEMFVGNSDIGNIRWYRTSEEGAKWKWIFYDADWGLFTYSFNSPRSFTQSAGMGQKHVDNTILRKLLTVPEYKDKFMTVFGNIYKHFTTEKMLEILEPLVEQISPEMQMHFARWGEFNEKALISELPVTSDGAYRYWQKRVERLRNTIRCRPHFLWQYIRDGFAQNGYALTEEEMLRYFGPQPELPSNAIP